MRSVWLLARREARVRAVSAPILLSTAALAVLLTGYLLVQGLVIDRSSTIRVGLAGQAIGLAAGLQAGTQQLGLTVQLSQVATVAEGTDAVSNGNLDVLVSGATDALTVTVTHDLDPRLRTALDGLVRAQVLDAQLAEQGLKPSDVDSALAQAGVKQVIELLPGESGRGPKLVVGLIIAVLLASVLVVSSTLAARAAADDKIEGLTESLLATTPPGRLLAGKLAGLGLLGLVQLLVLGLLGLLVAAAVGAPLGNGAGTLAFALLWYALGYAGYGTLFALSGALSAGRADLSRALAPAGTLLGFAVLGGFVLLGLAGADVANGLTAVLSLLPPFAPLLLPGRFALGLAPGWQVALALVLMLVALAAQARFAVRVYPAAVLRRGDPVKLTDVLTGSRSV